MATAQHPTDSSAALVEETAQQLRDAVTRREYEGIESRIVVYCDAVHNLLDALMGLEARRRAALTQALDLLEWTRLMLCASRAANAGHLKRAAFASRFLGYPAPRVPEIRFDL